MLRRALTVAAVLAVIGIGPARGDEDVRTAAEFVAGLREHGYYDLASEYLEQLRTEPDAPADLKATIDYELGRLLLDESAKTGDLVHRKELLEQARAKLDVFTKEHPKHELFTEASVQKARLLVERGHLAMLMGDETEDKTEKEAKLTEARTSFDQARDAYTLADQRLTEEYGKFPPFIPEGDARRERRDRTHTAMMDAQLQKAVVDYEEGQTYPLGSKERSDYLTKGMAQFEEIYKKYRTQFAGLTARMWQAKCYEERGEFGPAMAIYNELMEHGDPRLRTLQKTVGYFQIILYNKRKEFPLAMLGAQGWLKSYPEDSRTRDGIGVRFEMAKSIAAQIPNLDDTEKKAATTKLIDVLSEVVRYSSPFKLEALAMLKTVKPSTAKYVGDPSRMSFEDMMAQSDQALAAHEWENAITALKYAIRKADPAKDAEKCLLPRYNLAYCYYMNKNYYEAAVLAEHLAHRYPRAQLAPKITEIGMASLADAYNTYREIDRTSDLNHLIELATYTAETWPSNDQGDMARMTLGQIHQGMGQYDKALADFEGVREKSAKWVDAKTRAGACHWELSLNLRRKGTPDANTEADKEVEKALAALNAALKNRRDSNVANTDPGLVANACDIADILMETGKSADALALLNPIAVDVQKTTDNPMFGRLMADMLRCHIAVGEVDKALVDMNTLEKAGGGGNTLTQLYFSLGKLLEKEMEGLKKKGDGAGLARTQAAYQKFLGALAGAKAGQTYESLEWAGENMLTLGNNKEASDVFRRILDSFGKDQGFLARPTAKGSILRTQLKLAAALRGQRDWDGAEELVVKKLLVENPRSIETRIERAMLLEDEAAAGKASWNSAYTQWRALALQLDQQRPKPIEYYDAWYHAAFALFKDGKTALAEQTLGSVMRLSPRVGNPEMKAKYNELLSKMHAKVAGAR